MELRPDSVRKLSANLYDIPLLSVQWKTTDDGQRNCPKHIEFYSKNKFKQLMHLVGFNIRILHLVDGGGRCVSCDPGFHVEGPEQSQ